MRLITWNTHSLVGKEKEQVEEEQRLTGEYLSELYPDIIALQEVNQPRTGKILAPHSEGRWYSCEKSIPLREGNYLKGLLSHMPSGYRGVWLPIKIGYERWDEGLAFIYRGDAVELRWLPISQSRDYGNWRTRMALMLRREGNTDWFCNLHMGWWDDKEDPFLFQWNRLSRVFPRGEQLWLLGDFNSSPDVRGQGYDVVARSGFYDCFSLAHRTRGEETVAIKKLDGWQNRGGEEGMRIDQIWCRYPARVERCQVCMDGKHGPLSSDHYGVWVDTNER